MKYILIILFFEILAMFLYILKTKIYVEHIVAENKEVINESKEDKKKTIKYFKFFGILSIISLLVINYITGFDFEVFKYYTEGTNKLISNVDYNIFSKDSLAETRERLGLSIFVLLSGFAIFVSLLFFIRLFTIATVKILLFPFLFIVRKTINRSSRSK